MSVSASATPTPVTTTISCAGGSGTGRDVKNGRDITGTETPSVVALAYRRAANSNRNEPLLHLLKLAPVGHLFRYTVFPLPMPLLSLVPRPLVWVRPNLLVQDLETHRREGQRKSLIEQEAPLTDPEIQKRFPWLGEILVKYWIGKTLYQSEGMHYLVAHLSFLRRGAHLCAILLLLFIMAKKGTLLDLVG